MQLMLCFSLRINMKRLTSIRQSEDDTLSALNGFRFLSMLWVVFGHTSSVQTPYFYRSAVEAKVLMSNLYMQFLYNSFLSVDSFFFVSTFLFSYFTIKAVDKNGIRVFNIPIIMIRRIFRLLPSEMLLVGLTLLVPMVSSGPLWSEFFDSCTYNCRKNWWSILLFIQNLIPLADTCLLHLWYVAMDMQFFILTIVYLSIFFKNQLWGKLFCLFLLVGSIVACAGVTYFKGFPPIVYIVQTDASELFEFFRFTYLLPYAHVGVSAVGMTMGTFLARNPNVTITKRWIIVGWCLSCLGFTVPIYISYFWHCATRDLTMAEVIIYNSFHRLAWAGALSWLTLMCATGRAGLINDLLSWRGFIALNKPSYMLYLTHITVCEYFFRSMQGMSDTTKTAVFLYFFNNILASYIVAVFLRLLFEGPMEEVDKVLFKLFVQTMLAKANRAKRLRTGKQESEATDIESREPEETPKG